MAYRPKHVAEYLALRAAVGLFRCLPLRAAIVLAWPLAWGAHFLARFRTAQARARIREVFGEAMRPRDVRRTAWISWRNFVFSAVEMACVDRLTDGWFAAHVPRLAEVVAPLRDHARSGKGAVAAAFHMGSWEIMATALARQDVPVFILTGRQKNPLADAYFNRLRALTGLPAIGKDVALLKPVLRRLRKGEVLAFLPDVRQATEGIPVRFLGRTANVPAGMAFFARQAGVPIYPGLCRRVGWFRHEAELAPPVWPDAARERQADCARMTQEVFDVLDGAIRRAPEQWFWYNKRWILDPL